MTGLDYISHSLSSILWMYGDFYNNPMDFPHKRKAYHRFHEVEQKTQLHDIFLISPSELWKGNITIEGDADNFDLVLDYPFKFNKVISGFLDFG